MNTKFAATANQTLDLLSEALSELNTDQTLTSGAIDSISMSVNKNRSPVPIILINKGSTKSTKQTEPENLLSLSVDVLSEESTVSGKPLPPGQTLIHSEYRVASAPTAVPNNTETIIPTSFPFVPTAIEETAISKEPIETGNLLPASVYDSETAKFDDDPNQNPYSSLYNDLFKSPESSTLESDKNDDDKKEVSRTPSRPSLPSRGTDSPPPISDSPPHELFNVSSAIGLYDNLAKSWLPPALNSEAAHDDGQRSPTSQMDDYTLVTATDPATHNQTDVPESETSLPTDPTSQSATFPAL